MEAYKFIKSYWSHLGSLGITHNFLECLCETYRIYTPIEPEAPENQRALNLAFVIQSAPDIKRKLQKLEDSIAWIYLN